MKLKTIIGKGKGVGQLIITAVDDMEQQFNKWAEDHKNCRIIKTHVEYVDSLAILVIFYLDPL